MSHLDDGTIQAFLDDELPRQERRAAAEHLLGCDRCRNAREDLERATALFSEAVATLNAEPTGAVPRAALAAAGRPGAPGSFVKAAGLVLLLAAAASAAVPGSPVREWIESAVEPAPEPTPMPEPPPVEPVPAPEPAGVALVPDGAVEVRLADLEGVTIRLAQTDGESVAVSAVGADRDPTFRTRPGQIEVAGSAGGQLIIEIPRSAGAIRVLVDGEVYAEQANGELELRVPGDRVDGAIVWR
jgi:anti-sigma factor RsiW